jgi:hypothetical protein
MAASLPADVVAGKSVLGKGGLFVVKVQAKILKLIRLMTLIPTVLCLNA